MPVYGVIVSFGASLSCSNMDNIRIIGSIIERSVMFVHDKRTHQTKTMIDRRDTECPPRALL
jgi:hypothetical protein